MTLAFTRWSRMAGLLVALAIVVTAPVVKGANKRIVLIAGRPSHPPGAHEFRAGCMLLQKALSGVNGVTGDYRRGAVGFMVRNGEIAEPVAEITIASNLIDMFATLEPASDLEFRRGIDAPTILVPEMTVGAA